jgi:hypothetical protein
MIDDSIPSDEKRVEQRSGYLVRSKDERNIIVGRSVWDKQLFAE